MSEFFNLLEAMGSMSGTHEQRMVAHDVVGEFEIDTAWTDDLGFETAILVEDQWNPVERYGENKEEAEAGHERWKKELPTLTEITDLGYPGMVEPRVIKLRR